MDAALAEMDDLLLKEKKVLAQQRSEAMSAPAESSSDGGGSSGGLSGGLPAGGAAGGPGSDQGGAEASASSTGGGDNTSGDGAGAAGSHNAKGGPEGSDTEKGESRKNRVPPDIPDGRDDDIVARQLREAAMNEDDPALREKLWDEYRKYKSGQK